MKRLTVIGLALAALSGCDASPDAMGFQDAMGGSGDQRGDVDAGGAGGSAGSAGMGAGGSAAGGRSGTGGVMTASGGSVGSIGSTGGAAGSGPGGAGGSATDTLPCPVYSWSPTSGSGCYKQSSPGVFVYGTKNGHPCSICSQPTRPTGVPDCQDSGSSAICVLSCDECAFQ